MDFLYYNIRVAALIAIFYMFYRLLLSRDSLHQLNRFVLLCTAVASFVLPLCVITIHRTELIAAEPVLPSVATSGAAAAQVTTPWWQTALPIVFWTGVIVFLSYTILSISKVCILISRCEKHRQDDGSVIAVADGEVSPFSWMRYIVLSRSDYAHPDSAILMHEQEHVRRHHSCDVLLVDILTSLQWFNPAMWMLRYDLRAIHEYEADAAVLSHGVDARQYQYLLVRKAMAAAGYSVVNGINHSALKLRITMMNTHKQNKYSWLKALYVLPIVAVSLFASAKTVTDYKIAESGTSSTKTQSAGLAPISNTVSAAKVVNDIPAVDSLVKQKADGKSKQQTLEKTLFIVDGKEMSYSDISKLNPSEITRIDVLKNKASIEKFGGKGKNSVILISTKKDASADKVVDDNGVYLVPDEMPHFKGDNSAMFKFFAENIKYPAAAQKWGVQGRVVVSFIVNEDGSISDAKVVYNGTKGASSGEIAVVGYGKKEEQASDEERQKGEEEAKAALAQEAVRVISSMPAWVPGTKDGKPVRVKYNVPVSFKLQ